MSDARPFGEIAADIVARMEVEDTFLDDTGRPLIVGMIVQITNSALAALNGYHAEIVGLETLNSNGQPSGDGSIWLRLMDMDGGMLTPALVMMHPSRTRYIRTFP